MERRKRAKGKRSETHDVEESPRVRPEHPQDAIAPYAPSPGAAARVSNAGDPSAPSPLPRYAPIELIDEPPSFSLEPVFAIENLQNEIDALKDEINLLRRRDDTLKFYMTRLDEELRLAARLQQDFLPKTLPQLGPVHFHVLFRPAGYVSGDLYDVVRLDESHIGFFILDAVGHGMPAALLTMFIKRALISKEIGPSGYRILPPNETLEKLNEALIEQQLSTSTFATAMYGVIDTQSLKLSLASAGHPPPLLVRQDEMKTVDASGALLGIFEREPYTPIEVQLHPGDRLLLYTDGVEVAMNEDIASQKGAWKNELFRRRSLPAEGMLIDFSDQLDHEVGSLQPKDDLTLMVLEIKPSEPGAQQPANA